MACRFPIPRKSVRPRRLHPSPQKGPRMHGQFDRLLIVLILFMMASDVVIYLWGEARRCPTGGVSAEAKQLQNENKKRKDKGINNIRGLRVRFFESRAQSGHTEWFCLMLLFCFWGKIAIAIGFRIASNHAGLQSRLKQIEPGPGGWGLHTKR